MDKSPSKVVKGMKKSKTARKKISLNPTELAKAKQLLNIAAEAIDGVASIDLIPEPVDVVEYTPQIARVSPTLDINWIAVLVNYILHCGGAATKTALSYGYSWASIRAYIKNQIVLALRDEKISMEQIPRFMEYYLSSLGSRKGTAREGKNIAYSWDPLSIPTLTIDGSPISLADEIGYLYITTFISLTGIAPLVSVGSPTVISQQSAGFLCPLERPPGAPLSFSDAFMSAEWSELCTLFSKVHFTKSASLFDTQRLLKCVDQFAKISDPTWTSATPLSALTHQAHLNEEPADLRILQINAAQPDTPLTPDLREMPIEKSTSGTGSVGCSTLLWSSLTRDAGWDKTYVYPAPYELAELFNYFLRSYANLLQYSVGLDGLISGLPANCRFNTLELLLVFVNYVIPFFKDTNAFAGTQFPTPEGSQVPGNLIALSIDTKNFPTTNSQGLEFAADFQEMMREISGAELDTRPGEKGKKILRVPVLVHNPNLNLQIGIQDVFIDQGFPEADVFLAFPVPVSNITGTPFGLLDPLTGAWSSVAQGPVQIVNYTNGGIMNNLFRRWNHSMSFLSRTTPMDSGIIDVPYTRNGVLVIKDIGEEDVDTQLISLDQVVHSRLLVRKTPSSKMATERDPHFLYEYLLNGPLPAVYDGTIGSTSFSADSYASVLGYRATVPLGDYPEEDRAVKMAGTLVSAPTSGLPGNYVGTTNLFKLKEHKGGGWFWDDKQKREVSEWIVDPNVKFVATEFADMMAKKGYGKPIINKILASDNWQSAAEALTKALEKHVRVGNFGKVLKELLVQAGQRLLEFAMGSIGGKK